jgi:RimJ/RimL family protein N-acetyltransferase
MTSYVGGLQVRSRPQVSVRFGQLQSRIAGRIQLGFWSKSTRYGLRRDLSLPLEKPTAKIPISVRALVTDDLPLLLPTGNAGQDGRERREIAWRRAFIDKGAEGGFVAVDLRNNTPCYMQWLLSPENNGFIQGIGGFPPLERDEALLENAYTPSAYRGLGIMSEAMALIAERAIDLGVRHVLTFVGQQNIASLKGCQRAGFYPHLLHHRVQVGFGLIKLDKFETLSKTDPRRTKRF